MELPQLCRQCLCPFYPLVIYDRKICTDVFRFIELHELLGSSSSWGRWENPWEPVSSWEERKIDMNPLDARFQLGISAESNENSYHTLESRLALFQACLSPDWIVRTQFLCVSQSSVDLGLPEPALGIMRQNYIVFSQSSRLQPPKEWNGKSQTTSCFWHHFVPTGMDCLLLLASEKLLGISGLHKDKRKRR